MDTERGRIDLFLRKCDEVMQSKFIIADTKISELLKSIVTSDLLYAFFREITKDFDYGAACRECMGETAGDPSHKKRLRFPEDPEKKLAFIFCLLVDFDNKTLDLGEFLQEYFYEDGSVYESFYAFSNQVIKPFKNAVKIMFSESPRCAETMDASARVGGERKRIYASSLNDGKKVDALLILNALGDALEKGDERAVAALLCGYLYFAREAGWNSENLAPMAEELKNIKERI